MFNSENGYTLSDVAAVTNARNYGYGNDGFFGGGSWWIVLLFLFAFGGFGGGWGNNGAATTTAVTDGFAMNGLQSDLNGIQSNLSNGFYNINSSLLNGFAGTTAAITGGTAAIQSDICDLRAQSLQNTGAITAAINADTISNMQNTFGISSQLSNMQAAQQLANCQTDSNVSSAFAQLNYNLATEACADRAAVTTGVRDVIDNANNNTRQILDFLVQDRLNALQSENSALKTQISQSEQNAYLVSQLRPVASPAYLTANPYTGQLYPTSYWGWGNGCGCGMNNLVG